MTDKSMVKVTVEHDGDINVLEAECAFVVSFSHVDDDVIKSDVSLNGYASIDAVAVAIADALWNMNENHDGLSVSVSRRLAIRSIEAFLKDLSEEDGNDE